MLYVFILSMQFSVKFYLNLDNMFVRSQYKCLRFEYLTVNYSPFSCPKYCSYFSFFSSYLLSFLCILHLSVERIVKKKHVQLLSLFHRLQALQKVIGTSLDDYSHCVMNYTIHESSQLIIVTMTDSCHTVMSCSFPDSHKFISVTLATVYRCGELEYLKISPVKYSHSDNFASQS